MLLMVWWCFSFVCFPQATKEKRAQKDGSGTSQTSSDKHKVKDFNTVSLTTKHLSGKAEYVQSVTCVFQAGDDEDRRRDKQDRTSTMDSLIKELEALLKQDGMTWQLSTSCLLDCHPQLQYSMCFTAFLFHLQDWVFWHQQLDFTARSVRSSLEIWVVLKNMLPSTAIVPLAV